MSAVTDPASVTALIRSLNGYDDRPDLFVRVLRGGEATTSASCGVELEDPSTGQIQVFRVSVTMPEPGDDDYDGED